MQKLTWQNAKGEEINLTKDPFGITEWNGFSNVDLNVQSQEVPFHDGSVYLDSLLSQRELNVTLAINDDKNLETRYRLRRELIAALNPKLGEGYLIYTNDFISKRIKCIPQMPVFPTHNSNDLGTPKASLAWTACDPYWEDLEETIVNFPIDEQPVIKNEGDIPCQLKIDFLTGNVKNPKIKNLTTEKFIKYNGELNSSLAINTNFGQKSVIGENLIRKNISVNAYYNQIIYSEKFDVYVLVGSNGNIITTKDFKEFNFVIVSTGGTINSIAYSKSLDLFVAVGSGKYIYTSEDLMNWNIINTYASSAFAFNYVAYSESLSLFVTVGNANNDIYTSGDGVTWTQLSASFPSTILYIFKKVYWFEEVSLFIIPTPSGTITSSDGINWTEHLFNHASANITYCKSLGLFFMISQGITLTSSDGINWTEHENNLNTVGLYQLVICNDSLPHKFVYVASYESNSLVFFSYDGFIWTRENNSTSFKPINSMIYSKELNEFIGVGNQNTIITSSNAISWEDLNPNQFLFTNRDVIYVEKLKMYVSAAGSSGIQTSSDGINWTKRTNHNSVCIIYCDDLNLFVAGTISSIIISEDNGVTWKNVFNPSKSFEKIIYSKTLKLFVAIAGKSNKTGILYTSSDGINWTERINNTLQIFNDVIYCEDLNLFVVCGGYVNPEHTAEFTAGVIYTSSNGIIWTERTNESLCCLNSITYGKYSKVLVIVGGDTFTTTERGVVLTSEDNGVTWAHQTIYEMIFSKVIYSEIENIFIAVGSYEYTLYGKIYSSYNGYDWNETFSVQRRGIHGVCYSKNMNMFVAVGDIILTSSDGINWTDYGGYVPSLTQVIYSNVLNEFLIMGLYVIKLILKETNNLIQNISQDSDMNLNLQIGDNKFKLVCTEGIFNANIVYRQKYIGV